MELNENVMADVNLELNGFPFYSEQVTATESFPRRELTRTKVMGGTETVTKGEYIPREYTVPTTIEVPADNPDCFDEIFQELQNNPVEVVSKDMGEPFMAQVIIKKTHPKASPFNIELEINIKEIPKTTSNVTDPNDTIITVNPESTTDKKKDEDTNVDISKYTKKTTFDISEL